MACTCPSIHFSLSQDHGRLPAVRISKHSQKKTLKITVGCLTSGYPSIHKKLSRSRSVVWCVVWCVCVVCCVLCWCWCLVVVVLCVVWVLCVVVVCCVLCWCWCWCLVVVVLCGCCVLCVCVCVSLCVCEQGGKQSINQKCF